MIYWSCLTSTNIVLIVIVAIVVLVVSGAAIYFTFMKFKAEPKDEGSKIPLSPSTKV
jgi:flagellar basal body-associated protein FliL